MTNLIKRVMPAATRLLAIHLVGILFSGTCLLFSGCATGYLGNRLHDGADIFTATIGVGGGARARVGPVHAGAVPFNVGSFGLRGGCWDNDFSGITYAEQDFMIIPLSEVCTTAGEYVRGFAVTVYTPDSQVAIDRGKGFYAGSRIPFITTYVAPPRDTYSSKHPYSYYTQVEATIGVVFTVNLGFNPGELLDFVLGWTTLDIFDDDIE